MVYRSFNELFTKRELNEIRGTGKRNFWILFSILTGTFLAITIADGGLDYLRIRMSDPFVKNLDINVPFEKAAQVNTFKYYLNQDSLESRFGYDTVMAHVELSLLIWSLQHQDYRREKGRSIEPNNPLLNQILHGSNLVHGRGFIDQFDCGFIVTRRLLRELGYPYDTYFIDMAVPRITEGFFKAPVPVIAVVEELPGLASFVFTPYFYQVRNVGYNNPYSLNQYRDINLFMPSTDPEEIAEVKDQLRRFVSSHETFKKRDPYVESFTNTDSHTEGVLFNITMSPEPDTEGEVGYLYEILTENDELRVTMDRLHRYYKYDLPIYPDMNIAYDRISVMFETLKNVRLFKEYLFNNNKFELEVEMSKVRDKENFIAISFLTITMAVMLVLFSVFSVVLFIFNLLRNHLRKISMNLGTFKAFGLSNREIKKIYRNIIRRFCLFALFMALGVIILLDVLVIVCALKELSVFHILNIYTLGTVLAIIVSVELTVKITADRLLQNTPGDLIYGRDRNLLI